MKVYNSAFQNNKVNNSEEQYFLNYETLKIYIDIESVYYKTHIIHFTEQTRLA